jgi:hypothetical protein
MSTINSIKVRMYRHGFGDCFLLRFYSDTTLKYKMLIDCGLKLNDKVSGVPIGDVVDDIIKETSVKKGTKTIPHLDVLVVTHEHWDHVSAFKPEDALFDQFDIDKIWMAWTENPKDDEAKAINAHLHEGIVALGIATKNLQAQTNKKDKNGFYKSAYKGSASLKMRKEFDGALQSVTEFFGPLPKLKATTSPSGIQVKDQFNVSIQTQEAFDHIKRKLAKGKSGIKYFLPGSKIENIASLPGIRFYVLGPPKNALLNKDKPSSGAKKEVYFGQQSDMAGFVKGILKMGGYNKGYDDGSPFNKVSSIKASAARKNSYYKSTYYHTDERWRTIEDDWLDNAGSLALQMDSDTNNTSLALAIEMTGAEKVLLFPGDAQVGNWLSWHEHTWNAKDKDGNPIEVNATRLLNQTVFYKAGHHASHNATLKELGLELMIHEDLVTFIPEKEDQYNGIPFSDLVTRLNEKCKGRVLFSADKNFKAEDTLANKPDELSPQEWDEFKSNIKINRLFIEYTVKA